MNYNEQHKQEFKKWAKGRNVQSSTDRTILKVGDKVTFTNDNGCVFKGHEILGFDTNDFLPDNFIYLDVDCYWFPMKLNEVKKES